MEERDLPRNLFLAGYLKANPLEGVSALDRSTDTLGPRALGWDPRIHPSRATIEAGAEAWGQADAAAQQQASDAKASRRAALIALRDGTGDLTARQITAILRILAREVLGS